MEIGAAETRQLCVQVREQSALQQWVVAEIDDRNNVRGAKRHLFGLRKEVVRPAIEHQASDDGERHDFFRDKLGRVQMIERKCGGLFFGKKLHGEFPFRIGAGLNCLE